VNQRTCSGVKPTTSFLPRPAQVIDDVTAAGSISAAAAARTTLLLITLLLTGKLTAPNLLISDPELHDDLPTF